MDVTTVSQPFFAQFDPSIVTGTYAASSPTFVSLTTAIRAYADGFVAINAKFTPPNGGLAEQYSKNDGTPVSAVDLTWSYASALTAFQARAGSVSNSWGAQGLTVPSKCETGGGGNTVPVTFNVHATTVIGGEIQFTSMFLSLADRGLRREYLSHRKCQRTERLVVRQCPPPFFRQLSSVEQYVFCLF